MRWWCLLVCFVPVTAWARPSAPQSFCARYPDAPVCIGGTPACSYCHTSPPARNHFGKSIEANLLPGATRPLPDADFLAALPASLAAAETLDSDLDGIDNLGEIRVGTNPADGKSFPEGLSCVGKDNPQYKVCEYDARYVFRKVHLDFCGRAPTLAELDAGGDLDAALDACLQSEFWRGKDGQLWQIAHPKIRPVGSLKAGAEMGQIPLADYYDDYNLFAWSHIDDHDARDVLTADFYVQRSGLTYSKVSSLPLQRIVPERRAGNLTTSWMLVYFVMFTPLPRNIAAQTYRAYLGLDLAKQEGIFPIANEPVDYDNKGVSADYCAQCHATLDPLSYPFRNYNGLTGPLNYWGVYVPDRINLGFPKQVAQYPSMANIPENGAILGQPVTDLRQWAQVAANSDQFAVNIVRDYWRLLFGNVPSAEDNAAFVTLWKDLKTKHNYRVRAMLHDLIKTEAYGAP